MQTLTLYVSSPGDVRDERMAVGRVVEKWQVAYRDVVRIEILNPQDGVPAATCDQFVVLIGTELDSQHERQIEDYLSTFQAAGKIPLIYARSGKRSPRVAEFCKRFLSSKRAPAEFGSPEEFASRFDSDLGEILHRRFGKPSPEPIDGSPYLGTKVFDFEDAPRFFGRDRPIAEILEQLCGNHAEGHPFLLIYGDSTSGKSSLLRAGVAPRLIADGYLPDIGAWCGATMPPLAENDSPLRNLAGAISEALPELAKIRDTSGAQPSPPVSRKKRRRKGKTAAKQEVFWAEARLAEALEKSSDRLFAVTAIIAALDRVTAGKPAQLLVLLDGLDDLFDGEQFTAEVRESFFKAIECLVKSRRVWVVGTLGSDLFPRISEHEPLYELVRKNGGYFLRAPKESELDAIIRVPALAAGLSFERKSEDSRDLASQIREDAAARHDTLPLLEIALQRLYEKREGELLTWEAYREIGGLGQSRPLPVHKLPSASPPRNYSQLAACGIAGVALGALAMFLSRGESTTPSEPVRKVVTEVAEQSRDEQLAAADFSAAQSRVDAGEAAEALPFLVSALKSQPDHLDAQALLLATLRMTAWNFPEATLSHPLQISKLAFDAAGTSLFSSVDSQFNTTVRWDLTEGRIVGLLKPELFGETENLSVAPKGARLIVQRNEKTILCDADTMEPIKELPVSSNSSLKSIAWSSEGALLAYPSLSAETYTWVISDSATGETIREVDGLKAGVPLTAQINLQRLRALHSDGKMVEVPLALDQPLRESVSGVLLSQATLENDGNSAWIQQPGRDPEWVDVTESEDWMAPVMDSMDDLKPALAVKGSKVDLTGGAPIRLESSPSAVAIGESRLAIGMPSGEVVVHRILPQLNYSIEPGGEGETDGLSEAKEVEDAETGWLASLSEDRLTVWSKGSQSKLLEIQVGACSEIHFVEKEGMRGIEGEFGFVPLARTSGLLASEIEQLLELSRGLGGLGFEKGGRSLQKLSKKERLVAIKSDFDGLSSVFPGADLEPLVAQVEDLKFVESSEDAWLPVWERLAMVPNVDEVQLLRWSKSLGDHPWYQRYLSGRIARSDVDLDLAWQGVEALNKNVKELYELAEFSDEVRQLRDASWLASDSSAEGREEALAMLDAYVEKTSKAFDAEESGDNALSHAEALAWRGEADQAAEFLKEKLPADTKLTLRQAHFILSYGLGEMVGEPLVEALDRLNSEWLWRQWLQGGAGEGTLSDMVETTMNAVEGRGPAAVEALWVSLAEQDAEAIAVCLKLAKNLPAPLSRYAAGMMLWVEEKRMEAFSLWPEGFPDFTDYDYEDWHGWEGALPSNDEESLFGVMERDLENLTAAPDASVEDLRALAATLLDPATAKKFGMTRVREAMMACALSLSEDKESYEKVIEMLEKARLAGASPTESLRIEAKAHMAVGNFTFAYSRWLQLLESVGGEVFPSDYLDAALCVMEDLQDAAAIELLMRGKVRFPQDASYAYAAAWQLLNSNYPEEAGILLEHGFKIPFTGEEREIATAMLVCAAEQTLRTDRADQAYQELIRIDPTWGDLKSLQELEWPEGLRLLLISVAERQP